NHEGRRISKCEIRRKFTSKVITLVDDDIIENQIIENQIQDIEIKENEPLNKEIVNIKEIKDHPIDSLIEPKNVKEAIQDESWTMDMQDELNQFKTNDVWSLVPPPDNQTIIGTKWVSKNKLAENGVVYKNKARLVAQGYNRQEGIDFDETYAPMADAAQNTNNTTIRSILLAKKLTGLNFTNWYRNLRIVLKYEKKMKFVEQPIGPAHDPETGDPDTIDKYYEYEDGQSVSSYLLKMKSYMDTLERLGYALPKELGTIVELHAMLKLHEKGVSKKTETPAVLVIRGGKIQKDKKKLQGAKGKAKGKNKLAYALKTKIPPPPKRDNPAKDSICHHRKEVGYRRRNYPSYHAALKKRKNANEGLRRSRKLKHEPLSMYMGNGMRAAVEAIESFDLILPIGLIIVLNNCHFVPTVTRGVVSISCLVKNGYIHTFTNYGISISKDNVFFNAIPRDGIYKIDMHNLYLNISSNYNVSNKRAKHGLDSYYLWHYCLGHINKKRIDILQRDGLLQPTHDESHEKCKSCISGKIARKPFLYPVERAKDLLGLIHTDVCGPFRTMSREGANYFITFIDDFSRYDFVYLMKHKHEVFETFKGYALETAARILNMVPTRKVDRTPYEI
ncbi:zinc finger, CCHC-type containing protein, partial [Tanacetum coccineum]